MGTGQEKVTPDLLALDVSGPEDLEEMRLIFNASLDDMATKPLHPVTERGQLTWWMNPTRKRAWIVYEVGSDEAVGFIVLTERYGFETPMFAIAPKYRGKGYARWFIQEYIALARGALAGEQLRSNEIICRLNKEAGWEVLYSSDASGVDYLYHPGKSRQMVMAYHGVSQ